MKIASACHRYTISLMLHAYYIVHIVLRTVTTQYDSSNWIWLTSEVLTREIIWGDVDGMKDSDSV